MYKNYSKKIFDKASQRAKLLIANPEFKKEVKEIRNRFKIPQEGLNDQQNEKWHDDFYILGDEYFEKVWLKRSPEIDRLKNAKKLKEANELQKQLNDEAPINAFRIAVKTILKKYKLPLNWAHSIQRYILFNSIDLMWLPGNVMINEEIDQDTNLIKLSIGIDDSTTLEDIKKSWQTIKFHQKRLESYTKKKFQPIPNLDRDKRAYELEQKGKSIDEIGEIINLEFDDGLDNNQLNIAIKRYEKRLNIN